MGVPPLPAAGRTIAEVADVEVLVRRFYQAAIPDPLLGPIFEGSGVDWSAHIPFGDAELARWLELWEETVDCSPARSRRWRSNAPDGQRSDRIARPPARRAAGPVTGPPGGVNTVIADQTRRRIELGITPGGR
jgi:hypothetical protein